MENVGGGMGGNRGKPGGRPKVECEGQAPTHLALVKGVVRKPALAREKINK